MSEDGRTDATDAEGTEHARRDLRLFLAPLVCVMLCLVLFPTFTVLYFAYQGAQLSTQIKAYEAQQQELNNHKFCGLVDTILVPPPPPGPATSNPSRAFDQILHAKVYQLKVGLGC